jgi:hypothetical protein
MTETKSLWRVTGAEWIDEDPQIDVIAVTVASLNGDQYAVTCAGPKGMLPSQFIAAMRAAVAILILKVGGDLSLVGAETAGDLFDTGDQKPS